ncbi:MAG: hypothetical protein K6T94_19185 [Paenibacillus sp.]|nr:hypothetical protein [Paenibacillus sp.]
MEKQELIRIFDKQATQYEKKREDPKQKRWRQHLLSHAKGEVHVLSVRAGANFPFYPSEIKVTATVFSEVMLRLAFDLRTLIEAEESSQALLRRLFLAGKCKKN